MLRAEDLCLSIGNQTIMDHLTTVFHDGEVVGIIGPSGSGKSTFLKTLTLFAKPDSGKIYLNDTEITAPGTDVDAVRSRIGMVFQTPLLFHHLNVIENIMIGMLEIKKLDKKEAYEKALRLMELVGISDKALAYPDELSGGQKQRAAIARSISVEPEMILLDEPTSSLDPAMKGEVEAVIRILAASGHTMVIVSHEMELIRSVCTRVLFLKDGRILEEGSPEKVLDHPEHVETRRFVKALRVLEFSIHSKKFDFLSSQTLVNEYVFRNGIPQDIHFRLTAILEEFFQMVMIQPSEENCMHILLEYNRAEKRIEGDVRFSGPPFDPDDPMYFFSWPIISLRASEVSIEEIHDGLYTNEARLVIAGKT